MVYKKNGKMLRTGSQDRDTRPSPYAGVSASDR